MSWNHFNEDDWHDFEWGWWKPLAIAIGFLVVALLFVGCGPSKTPEVVRVEEMRAKLPLVSKVKTAESMTGFLPGDRLYVTSSPYRQIKAGDPIYAWYTNQPIPVFHVAVRPVYSEMPPHNRWLVKGTANAYPDQELLTEETYIGRWKKL